MNYNTQMLLHELSQERMAALLAEQRYQQLIRSTNCPSAPHRRILGWCADQLVQAGLALHRYSHTALMRAERAEATATPWELTMSR